MTTERTQTHLSDEEVGLLLAGKARRLLDGEKSRRELIDDLVKLLAAESDIVVRDAPLRTRGRCSFGRPHEGLVGTALFVPETKDN
jgi:hypothetical protein